MKKNAANNALWLFISLNLLASCEHYTKTDPSGFDNKFTYFKDKKTGLCFGAITNQHGGSIVETSTSITCVPCDSLKKIGVH